MIPYLYGPIWTPGALFEHDANVSGRLWTSIIEAEKRASFNVGSMCSSII